MDEMNKSLLELIDKKILVESLIKGKRLFHLNSLCKIQINENIIKKLKVFYNSEKEIGGYLLARPSNEGSHVLLKVEKLFRVSNASPDPEDKFIPNKKDVDLAMESAFGKDLLLPIFFHSHPTSGDDEVSEINNYFLFSNTSEADQQNSYIPLSIDGTKVIMPDCIIACNPSLTKRLFIGFYNGLIAPIEFSSHRNDLINEKLNKTLEGMWSFITKNKYGPFVFITLLVALFILIVRFPRKSFEFLLTFILIAPVFLSDQKLNKYFAQVVDGDIVIEL